MTNESEVFITGPFAGQRVELLWNKGIAALCDRRIPDEFPDGVNYSAIPALAGELFSSNLPDNVISCPSSYRSIRDGEVIWVRLSWLKSFVKQVLPLLDARFILVTGDSDSCVPSELTSEARAVLESPQVVHWYTQNYDGSMAPGRISPIPIGIDLHMLSEKPVWGEDISSPLRQEQTLESIRKSLPSLGNRTQRVYVDFAWQRGFDLLHHRRFQPLKGTTFHEDRRRLGRKLRKNELVYCQTGAVPRNEMWRKRGEYAFVLSPHGMGLDCHRTWEALALGHIVLVPSSSLDALYTDLPVIPLRSWGDITLENLEKWLRLFGEFDGVHPKLKSSYWVNRMRSIAEETLNAV